MNKAGTRTRSRSSRASADGGVGRTPSVSTDHTPGLETVNEDTSTTEGFIRGSLDGTDSRPNQATNDDIDDEDNLDPWQLGTSGRPADGMITSGEGHGNGDGSHTTGIGGDSDEEEDLV